MSSTNPLRQAIFDNNLAEVARLCSGNPNLINQRGDDGYTPLSDALFYNNIQALELLHAAGVDYTLGWDGKSPLYWALLYSNPNIICFLLSAPKLKPDADAQRLLDAHRQGVSPLTLIQQELLG